MALAQLVETLSDKLFFTVITVADELNAYKVFETLNARGVRLSSTDLLKNYLFSLLAREPQSDTTMDELERRWELIIGRLGSKSCPDCLRIHWNSRSPFVRESELFKAVRSRITCIGEVLALMGVQLRYPHVHGAHPARWLPVAGGCSAQCPGAAHVLGASALPDAAGRLPQTDASGV